MHLQAQHFNSNFFRLIVIKVSFLLNLFWICSYILRDSEACLWRWEWVGALAD